MKACPSTNLAHVTRGTEVDCLLPPLRQTFAIIMVHANVTIVRQVWLKQLDLKMVIFLNSNNIWVVKVDLLRNLVHSSLPTKWMHAIAPTVLWECSSNIVWSNAVLKSCVKHQRQWRVTKRQYQASCDCEEGIFCACSAGLELLAASCAVSPDKSL